MKIPPQSVAAIAATSGDARAVEAFNADQLAAIAALDGVFAPLAQLCLSKGIRVQAVEERLRVALVRAAHDTQPSPASACVASRISAATGLTRREVNRLSRAPDTAAEAPRSPITELFTQWLSDPTLRGTDGKPLQLRRHGPAPSFEALAQSVTRDVHPRTLLDELCRLQLATRLPASDEVALLRDAFVPRGDWAQMLQYLGDNVGDHLRAAVANVLNDGRQHMEQAIFADELSAESVVESASLITTQWRTLLTELAPQLEQLIEKDRQLGRPQNHSIRIGMYSWSSAMPPDLQASTSAITQESKA
ncbi:DUF6502 family protein [Polaromonas sp.]|jgi:hypothetical protein|uniref:DUF6502 family protein n=1 Tax=Polaromonas sp. TaxID=1869339 RepID=UPI002B967CA8|nr:DUF6502 family protein [Polaromonas sp.]HQS32098.1 DUF6502 family protein [Polaromonas sp.]HQS90536.1 DUF6502 family protein [Polaromonas sp.]